MSPEGPKDSPAVNEPTTTSAVGPLPPGSNAEEVVDALDERIEESWADMESDDDTNTRSSSGPNKPDDEPDDEEGESSEPTA